MKPADVRCVSLDCDGAVKATTYNDESYDLFVGTPDECKSFVKQYFDNPSYENEMADALGEIAAALRKLGLANAETPFGALEAVLRYERSPIDEEEGDGKRL